MVPSVSPDKKAQQNAFAQYRHMGIIGHHLEHHARESHVHSQGAVSLGERVDWVTQ